MTMPTAMDFQLMCALVRAGNQCRTLSNTELAGVVQRVLEEGPAAFVSPGTVAPAVVVTRAAYEAGHVDGSSGIARATDVEIETMYLSIVTKYGFEVRAGR